MVYSKLALDDAGENIQNTNILGHMKTRGGVVSKTFQPGKKIFSSLNFYSLNKQFI